MNTSLLLPIRVHFHQVDWSDWISIICWFGGRHRSKMYVHCSLEFDSQIIDFTWDGIAWYLCSDNPRDIAATITLWATADEMRGVYDRVKILMLANLKLSLKDLITFAACGYTDGLLCSSFIQLALGQTPTACSPTDLYNNLRQYDGGFFETYQVSQVWE